MQPSATTMDKSTGQTLLYTIALFAVVTAQPQYRVKLQVPLKYAYKSNSFYNQLSNGSCCNSAETFPCTIGCSGVTIELCFREQGHDPRDMDINNCPLGRRVFTPLPFNRAFQATGDVELQPTAAASTTLYPREMQVLYKIQSGQPDAVIDQGIRALPVPVSTDREKPLYRAYFVLGDTTRLIINSLAIVCIVGYTGSNCNVRECIPRDDSGGHFSCDSNQNKVCLPGYQDPETNCVDPVPAATTDSYTTDSSTNEPPTESISTQPSTSTQPSITESNTMRVNTDGIITESTTMRVNTDGIISPTEEIEINPQGTTPESDSTPADNGPTESSMKPEIIDNGNGAVVSLSPERTERTEPTTPAPSQEIPFGVAIIAGIAAGSVILLLIGAAIITTIAVLCIKYRTNKPIPTLTADETGTTVNTNEEANEFTMDRNPLYHFNTRERPAGQVAVPLTEDADSDSYYETIDSESDSYYETIDDYLRLNR